MSNIKDFMQEVHGEREEVKLDRFKQPFVVEAISENDNDKLKKSATKKYRSKSGNIVRDLDTDKYADLLVARCVVEPDLHNAELQAFYKTEGDPVDTLKTMLLAGEYSEITTKLLEINGFNESEDDLADEVKN